MKPRSVKDSEAVIISLPIGRDEMNLAEFPTTLLTDHAPDGVKTLRFEDGQGGHLTITGSDAYGLPTAFDADVLIGLIQLTKIRNNFTESKVHFTRYELLRLLNWPNEGKSYQRIDKSLNRWVGVTLVYDDSWYDNRVKRVGSAKMHILESVVTFDGSGKDETGGQGNLPLSSFTWNKIFMESCQADNLKRLDLETYFSLRSAISKRIYRFLDKKFYHREAIEFDLREFAFERVGLSRSYARNAGKIKEKLQAALEELEAKGFLESLAKDVRYRREGRNWIIRLSKLVTPALPSPRLVENTEPSMLGQLVTRGVTKVKAAELVRNHRADYIEAKIEILDFLAEKKDKRVEKSPLGWLVKAIENDYPTPKGFISKAEREQQAEMQLKKDHEAAEARRRERQQADAKEIGRQEILAYRKSLTPAQLAEHETQAIAQAEESARQFLEEQASHPSHRKMLIDNMIDAYILSKLREQGKLPVL